MPFESFQSGFEFYRYGYLVGGRLHVMVIAAAIGITILFRVVRVRRLEAV